METDITALNHSLVLIEYPGIVLNVDKALKTLGGIEEISKVNCTKNRRLELRFRPDDAHCKPACGDRYKTNTVLLKVKVKRSKEDLKDPENSVASCTVVGRIQTAFKFKCVCDFQFLPMLPNPDRTMRSMTSELLPKRLDEDNLVQWLNTPCDYFLPPAAFSRVDSISYNSYMYRKEGKGSSNLQYGSLIGRTRKRRSGHAIFVSFDVPSIPTKPREKALKLVTVKFLSGQKLDVMRKCFEERPIWSKLALMCVTSFSHDQLKFLLPAVAYYFVTGPFRVMWVRFGYDPRKDPSSRIYQTLDYRIRAPTGLLSLIKAKRSYSSYLLPSKSTHSMAKSVVLNKDLLPKFDQSTTPAQRAFKNDSFMFHPSVLPPARQMFYQYCDIKAPEIELMLSRLPKLPPNAVCDAKKGWLPGGFDVQCRDILNNHILQLLKKEASLSGSTNIKEEDDIDDLSDEEHWEEEFDDEDIDNIE